jgi:hypothetical protein
LTLGEYLQCRGRGLKAGDRVTLWMDGGRMQVLWIGDATPLCEPSENGIFWNTENKYGTAELLEITSYREKIPEIIYKDCI